MRRTAAVLLSLSVLLTSACQRAEAPRASVIVVDADTRYQTIDGWAYMPRMWEEDKPNNRFDGSFEPYTGAVARFLVEDVGLNAVRVEIQSGMENPNNGWGEFYSGRMPHRDFENQRFEKFNDNDDPYVENPDGFQFQQFDWRLETMVLPVKRALNARGETLYVNVNFTDFAWSERIRQGTLSHARQPEEYAEFVLVYFKRLRDKYGIIPDSLELILEPDNTRDWRGSEIAHALLAVRKRLAENGFRPEFVATSAASTQNSVKYFEAFLTVPGAVGQLDTLSYHRYGERVEDVRKLRAYADQYGLKTAMLEKLGVGIDVLLEDLLVGGVSAWQQWAIDGYVNVDRDSSPASPELTMTDTARELSSVFCFVRRGAVRIAASSDNPHQKTVAFLNRDNSAVLVVRDVAAGGPLTLRGLPPGRFAVRFVGDADATIRHFDPVETTPSGELVTSMPGAGIMTLYTDK